MTAVMIFWPTVQGASDKAKLAALLEGLASDPEGQSNQRDPCHVQCVECCHIWSHILAPGSLAELCPESFGPPAGESCFLAPKPRHDQQAAGIHVLLLGMLLRS